MMTKAEKEREMNRVFIDEYCVDILDQWFYSIEDSERDIFERMFEEE